jgi:hypothetical protein
MGCRVIGGDRLAGGRSAGPVGAVGRQLDRGPRGGDPLQGESEQVEQVFGEGEVDVAGGCGGVQAPMRQLQAGIDIDGRGDRVGSVAGQRPPQRRGQAHRGAEVAPGGVGEALLLVRDADVAQSGVQLGGAAGCSPVEAAAADEHDAIVPARLGW